MGRTFNHEDVLRFIENRVGSMSATEYHEFLVDLIEDLEPMRDAARSTMEATPNADVADTPAPVPAAESEASSYVSEATAVSGNPFETEVTPPIAGALEAETPQIETPRLPDPTQDEDLL